MEPAIRTSESVRDNDESVTALLSYASTRQRGMERSMRMRNQIILAIGFSLKVGTRPVLDSARRSRSQGFPTGPPGGRPLVITLHAAETGCQELFSRLQNSVPRFRSPRSALRPGRARGGKVAGCRSRPGARRF